MNEEIHSDALNPLFTRKSLFHECIIFHLLTVFHMDVGEQLRKYVDKVVKKPNRLPIRHHVKRVQELNRYIGHLPCLHYSSKNANGTLEKVKPFDDAELAGLILEHVPESWRVDRDKMIDDIPRSTRKLLDELEKIEASRKEEEHKRANDRDPKRKAAKALERPIPKKKRTEISRSGTPKNCALCEKHGGAHKTHNTSQCRKYNTDGTRKKDSNQSGSRESKKTKGHSYAQLSERCEKLEQKLKKAHKKLRSASSSVIPAALGSVMTTLVMTVMIATPPEVIGRVALGNQIVT